MRREPKKKLRRELISPRYTLTRSNQVNNSRGKKLSRLELKAMQSKKKYLTKTAEYKRRTLGVGNETARRMKGKLPKSFGF